MKGRRNAKVVSVEACKTGTQGQGDTRQCGGSVWCRLGRDGLDPRNLDQETLPRRVESHGHSLQPG